MCRIVEEERIMDTQRVLELNLEFKQTYVHTAAKS